MDFLPLTHTHRPEHPQLNEDNFPHSELAWTTTTSNSASPPASRLDLWLHTTNGSNHDDNFPSATPGLVATNGITPTAADPSPTPSWDEDFPDRVFVSPAPDDDNNSDSAASDTESIAGGPGPEAHLIFAGRCGNCGYSTAVPSASFLPLTACAFDRPFPTRLQVQREAGGAVAALATAAVAAFVNHPAVTVAFAGGSAFHPPSTAWAEYGGSSRSGGSSGNSSPESSMMLSVGSALRAFGAQFLPGGGGEVDVDVYTTELSWSEMGEMEEGMM